MNRILILEPDPGIRQQLTAWLEANGFAALASSSLAAATASFGPLNDASAAVVNESLASSVFTAGASIPILVIADHPTVPAAVSAIKAGAANYLAMPQTAGELLGPLREAIVEAAPEPSSEFSICGSSEPMQALLQQIARAAPTDSTVLIRGESGTGKELVARALHAGSQRRRAALITLNCAAVPTEMIEAELFGHGDSNHNGGLLDAAAGGTLFLDEIGELPLETQGRLLQVLSGNALDVRLIAATQRDLAALIETRMFRQDLYYRLNVVSLEVPPLRERGDDILMLAEDIAGRISKRLGRPGASFSAAARQDMVSYHWPGNVRELENAIERAIILGEGEITTTLLAIQTAAPKPTEPAVPAPDQTMEDYFVSFVNAHQDHLTETELAERLGISRKSLWERRQRLNIPRKKTRKRGPRRNIS